jgi:hypothetical protein
LRLGFLFFAVAVAGLAQPAWAEIGRVKTRVGVVAIKRNGAPVAVQPGAKLEQGDVVVTGKDGRVGITFADNTRFAVGPNSRIVLSQFGYDPTRETGRFLTQVQRGSLGVVSGKIAHSGHDAMRVRTPTSMLGVRGTKFVVEVK